MADIDIDPFGEHESRPEESTDENIPLDPVTPGRSSTWEPTREQETSFGGESQITKLMKDYVRDLYKKLSENIGEIPELFHYDYFKLEDGELYCRGSRKPLTTEGKLKLVGMIADILGKNRLRRLDFNIPAGKLTARKAIMLNKAAEELPSESDITKVDDIELQEIAEKNIEHSFSDKRRPDRYRRFIRTWACWAQGHWGQSPGSLWDPCTTPSFTRVVRFR